MGAIVDLLQGPSNQGSSNSRSSYNELLLNPGSTVAGYETTGPTLQASAIGSGSTVESSAQTSPPTISGATSTNPVPVQGGTASSTPVVDSSAGSTGSQAALDQPIAPSPAYDGLLVSWTPLSTAQDRANARAAFGLGLVETVHTQAMKTSGAGPIEWVSLPPGLSAEQAMAALSKRPGVAFAEKNWKLEALASSNDTYYTNGNLWGMYGDAGSPTNAFGSHAAEAWAAGYTGSSSVYVGIIDEGYQYTHADLAANAGTNPGEIAANGIDDDRNGYIDDVYGWDFDGNNSTVYDGTGDDHGTHVAGTIGGRGGNGSGVAGVTWDVKLLNAKFLGATSGTITNAIKAVDYFTTLKNNGVNIVATNNSWGGGGYSTALHEAIIRAAKASILFVAAAGNGGSDGVGDNNDSVTNYPSNYNATVRPTNSTVTPASYDNVIAVAAITSTGGRSSFSNYGATTVDLGAPGSGIWSTVPNGAYADYSGTSMATPHVTGASALLSSAYPQATAAQIKLALLEGAAPTTSLAGITVSGGRLDIPASMTRLSQLVTPLDPNAPTYAVSGPASVNEGSPLSLTISTTNVATGSTLYWSLSGNGITTSDFGGQSLQGSVTTNAAGTAVFQAQVAADVTTEGNESLSFAVFSDSSFLTRVAGTTVILNDTSKPAGLGLWGTTASDTITGGGGPDRVAGVVLSGTTASAMGGAQIDTLTGNADADVFLLGDGRGVFYDDRVAGNLGSGDYALIKDFVPGSDKLQVRAGTSYLYTVGASGLSLYWDRNNNGNLNSSGTNRDELIAVLPGVSALTGTDLVAV